MFGLGYNELQVRMDYEILQKVPQFCRIGPIRFGIWRIRTDPVGLGLTENREQPRSMHLWGYGPEEMHLTRVNYQIIQINAKVQTALGLSLIKQPRDAMHSAV